MNKSLVTACRGVLTSLVLLCGFVSIGFAQKSADEKLSAEQLISRHLESIGPAEARSAVKSVVAVGTSKATFHGRGAGIAEGITVIASKGNMYMIAMKFNTSDYPFEKMGFDGSDFTVGFVRPGIRSNLGSFLRTNERAFKTGVMSGALSTSWALLDVDPKEVKVKYSGLKKIDGKQLHALDYNPKKGSDLTMTLYFDPETYQHVRTEYKRIIAARQGANVDASAGQSETRYKMVEEFSNFNEVDKLKLPHTYKLSLEILTGNGTTSYEWLMELQKIGFNQEIDDKDFKVDSY